MSIIIDGNGIVTAGGTASTQGKVVLGEQTGNGTNTVTLQAPASLAADLTFTMPTADGTNGQVLQTNGSGALSFVNQTAPTSLATPLAVIGDATAGAEIRLPEDTDNGSNYVALKAPDNLASNLTLTLPSADGTSGQVLQTNGSGTLSFGTPAGGFSNMTVYATPGTYTWNIPAGVTKAKVTVTGGGGGGSTTGGAAGGTVIAVVTLSGSTATVIVGAAGAANGGTGGASSFASTGITTLSGSGGTGASTTPVSGTGPAGALILFGGPGSIRWGNSSTGFPGGFGGASYWGGGATSSSNSGGSTASTYGAGGSGYGTDGGNGAAGAGGVVVIEY